MSTVHMLTTKSVPIMAILSVMAILKVMAESMPISSSCTKRKTLQLFPYSSLSLNRKSKVKRNWYFIHHLDSRLHKNLILEAVVSNLLRGGADHDSSENPYFNAYDISQRGIHGASPRNNQGHLPPQQTIDETTQNFHPPMDTDGHFISPHTDHDFIYGQRETVEDRVSAWRKQQQHILDTQSPEQAASAVDEQGRFKLFATVSRVSVSFFFFILMWRTVHHYELADVTFGTSRGSGRAAIVRMIVVTPLVILFLGEMMGAILGLTGGGQSHAMKKRLKGVLNLHKGVELTLMLYNIVRLAVWPSKYVMREVYIGRTISNFFFLVQTQLYTKLSWDDVSKSSTGNGYGSDYYNDYQPDISGFGEDSVPWNNAQSAWGNGFYDQADQRHQQYPEKDL